MDSAAIKSAEVPFALRKADPSVPVIKVTGLTIAIILAGTTVTDDALTISFDADTPIEMQADALQRGTDLEVFALADNTALAVPAGTRPESGDAILIGGFHFAPGGNAAGTTGGDKVPAINPYSCWDLNFRPACANARAMALVDGKVWVDIYLTGVAHATLGTSVFGQTIADGNSRPAGVKALDYEAAKAILAQHGKQLLGAEEFFAAAYGVTERSSNDDDPTVANLDAPRTSKYGIMQATGNMWVWGHDGHPDIPRASLFGGSWIGGGLAGSRYALLVHWPGSSSRGFGVRGRSDHLILV